MQIFLLHLYILELLREKKAVYHNEGSMERFYDLYIKDLYSKFLLMPTIQIQYNHYGIYGLYRNNQLVYIGSTSRPFKERIREHYQNIQKAIETGKSNFQVYSLFTKNDRVSVSILIDMYEVGYKQLTEKDLRAMELAMITYFAPIGNVSGLKYGFQF